MGDAIAYLSRIGTVSIPLTDSQDYDLIAEIDDRLYKVQVKTTQYKSKYGIYKANLSVKGGNRSFNTIKKFDNTKVDYVYVMTSEGKSYFIPTSSIVAKGQLSLSKENDKYLIN